ncbi:MAG: hypothetical protein CL512_06125 [Actinobacteria bacterium]|nr:hypothetical protein [Actinomycetota bacterium]
MVKKRKWNSRLYPFLKSKTDQTFLGKQPRKQIKPKRKLDHRTARCARRVSKELVKDQIEKWAIRSPSGEHAQGRPTRKSKKNKDLKRNKKRRITIELIGPDEVIDEGQI